MGIGMRWASIPDKGAAHAEAWVHHRAQLVDKSKAECVGGSYGGGSTDLPQKIGKPRSHSTLSSWLIASFLLFPLPSVHSSYELCP